MMSHFKTKSTLVMILLSLCYFAGCVDTSVQTIPSSVNYQSQLKVVNLISGAGTATLSLNGQALGTAAFGDEVPGASSDFLTVSSGSKTLAATFTSAANQSYQFAATTDYKMRIFLVGTAASNELVATAQRYIWETKNSAGSANLYPADTGHVAFFNGSPDAILNGVTAIETALNDTIVISLGGNLEMGDSRGYSKLKAGNYSFDVKYNDSLHAVFTKSIVAKSRYSAVLYDVAASLKNIVLTDD